jgi:hypothetical protein
MSMSLDPEKFDLALLRQLVKMLLAAQTLTHTDRCTGMSDGKCRADGVVESEGNASAGNRLEKHQALLRK